MKQEKNYTLTIKNGYATLTKKENGFSRSARCEFPLYTEILNQDTNKMELKKQTKKQIEKYLLGVLAKN